jgi:hypothetical protein
VDLGCRRCHSGEAASLLVVVFVHLSLLQSSSRAKNG